MIRLRCSGTPALELELAGSRSDLSALKDAILHCCRRKRPLLEVAVDQDFDPAPYERRLKGLRLVRSKDKLRLDVEDDRLLISGTPDLLIFFARSLPCNEVQVPAQVKFDPYDRTEQLQADSPGILLTLTE